MMGSTPPVSPVQRPARMEGIDALRGLVGFYEGIFVHPVITFPFFHCPDHIAQPTLLARHRCVPASRGL